MSSIAMAVRRIPNSVEVVAVLAVAFGGFIYESTRWFASGLNDYGWWVWEAASVDGSRIGSTGESVAITEIVFFLLLFTFLRTRGWTLHDLNLRADLRTLWHAIALFIVLLAIHVIFFKLTTAFNLISKDAQLVVTSKAMDLIDPDFPSDYHARMAINLYTWIPSIIADAFYWEFFLLCYLFKRLDKSSVFAVIGLSAVVRLLCHLHTGPHGWISILVVSGSMGWYYWKYRNLTVPVIVHTGWNFITFGFYPAQ